jgi:RNA polymerase sigma-70 factor, ECF subfamily
LPDDWHAECNQDVSSGGIDNMEGRLLQIEDELDPAVLVRQKYMRELQDAVSQNRSFFYRRAYRYVGDPNDAEDAVQDALLSAYRHLDHFKGTAKMTTWLTSIVINSALSKLRKRPRHPHTSLEERLGEEQEYRVADTLADIRPSPEGEYVRSEMRRHLMQHVAELSPLLRKVIQLRYFNGLSTRETARTLGVTEATIKARVSRARSKLTLLIHRAKNEGLT